MTARRRDSHSTEFGLWTRDQSQLDSKLGYVATNLDFIWANYKTGDWMLIEEKRFGAHPKDFQARLFRQIDELCQYDSHYKGFHFLIFENTGPHDGWIELDGVRISEAELISFLRFSEAKVELAL